MKEILPKIRIDKRNVAKTAAKIRRRSHDLSGVEKRAREIISEVRRRGDAALVRYSREFDGANLAEDGLKVKPSDIQEAAQRVDKRLLSAMKFALKRLQASQALLLEQVKLSNAANGFDLAISPRPLASVGCYIPGGRASYASTVLMTAGLAQLAGVKRIVLCSPSDEEGKVSDAILAAAYLCNVGEVYRVGGAQAIAALAYGTESIPRVRKIVGPGGVYVSVAKKLVAGDTPVDFFAGPTELVVVGDATTDPRTAAWDLVGQAEHGQESICGLVTWSERLATRVQSEVATLLPNLQRRSHVEGCLSRGFAAVCSDDTVAADFVNALAPEHVEIMVKNTEKFASLIEDAGLLLIGPYSPCAASDYCAGSDHVLPTEGFAKTRAGLSVLDFVKLVGIVEGSRVGLKTILSPLKQLAYAEGLPNHFLSVESRFRG